MKTEVTTEVTSLDRLIMVTPKVILGTLMLIGIVELLFFLLFGVVLLIAAAVFLYICLRRIPYRPPHVGVVIIWGKRVPVIKKEGWHLFAPFFPFMYTVTMVKVEKVNLDFVFSDIRCKAREEKKKKEEVMPFAGGEVTVYVSLTYFANYKSERAPYSLISFINSGDHDGVQKIIRDLVEEDMREMAHDYSWEEITFSTGEIKKRMVKKLTGEELTEEVEEELNKNGLPDVADLGILITRFNVGRVKEQGELAKAAETFAKEQQERRGAEIEMKFVRSETGKLKRLGVPASESLDAAQLATGKASKKITTVRGLEGPLQTAGTVLSAILEKTTGKEGKKK